jgi:hypothetical protein
LPAGIGLATHRELVEMFGDLVIVVEVFNVIDFAVAVEVVQTGDLIAAGDVNGVVD